MKKGRPSNIDKIDLKVVAEYAELGATMDELAGLLGVSQRSLYDYKKINPEFSQTLENARNKADLKVVKSLYDKCLDGDVAAQKYWLTCRRPQHWKADKAEATRVEGLSKEERRQELLELLLNDGADESK